MAAVRGLRVSVKTGGGLEPEPMEVEEGEVEAAPDGKSPREVVSGSSRRYENKAGTFITGIDVTSKEAIEKKEQRAKRFHFRAEDTDHQRNVVLDLEMIKKAIPKARLEALYVCGVDDMSTQDIFGFFKQYPPGFIEWLDDSSCNVVWLDEMTATRALLNLSTVPTDKKCKSKKNEESTSTKSKKDRFDDSSGEETEEGEVDEENPSEAEEETEKKPLSTLDTLSQAEEDSLLQNDLRPSVKITKGNRLHMRFATKDDKKELGAARRSQYYMKYGNPNYGGMKGILSNSWKRRFHSRRVQRDVTKKSTLIGDDVGIAPAYKHLHSEEPIEEEEEEEDMDEDDRVVVEYRDELQAFKREREGARRSAASDSDSDEMDYDLELKMISTPSPKKTMKMTMYADEVESQLKTIRNSMRSEGHSTSSSVKNRIGSKSHSEKPVDVRLLLEEKRQGSATRQLSGAKSDVRQRLGKRAHSPEPRKPVPVVPVPRREVSDVHSRLGLPKQSEGKGLYADSKEKKTGSLWNRLGTTQKEKDKPAEKPEQTTAAPEEDDSVLQQAWGAMIKKKEQIRQKKSRLDSLPSLQIEISRESSSGSDTDS
ncbi:nuclear cap-binding protein subunit 3 isoform X2 [Spea bombifrons]|uniref:nuclear cap-binding protein subunit 3 isoform X2 n=1 Tax=Spea bombifrons TaxID=233779 RepID=UPI00234A61FE|nr:nuclear cap-binding protein subunit 3 isoform X2 [Spea bombifrons]